MQHPLQAVTTSCISSSYDLFDMNMDAIRIASLRWLQCKGTKYRSDQICENEQEESSMWSGRVVSRTIKQGVGELVNMMSIGWG